MTMTSPLPSVRGHITIRPALWIAAAVLIAIALSYVLPAASSYHVAAPELQWVTSL
jgi:hypothetical protein